MRATGQEIVLSDKAGSVHLRLQVVKQAKVMPGLPCFAIIRNEQYFLPHFLRHYRALGIGHFIFYDDGSNDGSRELLLAQDDCTILTSHYKFRQNLRNGRPFLYVARNLIPGNLVKQGWCLTVDADEFLLLPKRFSSLADVIAELEENGQKCVLAPMVDLYPATLGERNFDPALSPFEGGPWWFDPDPAFEVTANGEVLGKPGGIRHRILLILKEQHPERYAELFPDGGNALLYSKLWKVPLLKNGHGIVRMNTHSVTAPVPADIQLAIAHFKFYPDLDRKIADALSTQSYARASFEYRVLDTAIRTIPDQSLLFDRSLPFDGPEAFERAKLMFA